MGLGTLQWALEPLLYPEYLIDINVYEHSPGSVIDNPIPDVVSVTIVSAQQDSSNPEFGNLTSIITIKVTDNNIGKHIVCSNGQRAFKDSPSIVIPSVCTLTILFCVNISFL